MKARTFAIGALALTLPVQAAPVRKLYADPANGITFNYPATWLLNGDDDAATAKLRIISQGQPNAVVQLEGNFAEEGPYKGTDFESGAFAYVVAPSGTEEACFAALDHIAEGVRQPTSSTWNGVPARKLDTTYTVAGIDDIHHTVAAYRNARCLFFETVIIKKSKDAVEKPLPPVRWQQLQAAFATVLDSVRFTTRATPR